MKKIVLIVAIVCCSAKSFCQSYPTPVTDTLGYLRYLVANKQLFIGQPFSVLNDSLKIQIKYFSPFGAYHSDQSLETHSRFAFNFKNTLADFYLTYPGLQITWQQPLDLTLAYQIAQGYENTGFAWGTRAYQHYANAVVKDVRLVE
jgi:hypothetical protein